MTQVYREDLFHIFLCYLDDLLVFSSSVSEHLERLDIVLEKLRKYVLKLKLAKCQFLQKEVSYLGYKVSEEGIASDPAKIDVVKTWRVPETLTELQSWVGFASYYRRFVPRFTQRGSPLHPLIATVNQTYGKGRRVAAKETKLGK